VAIDIDKRTAAVAGVDGGVGLEEVFVGDAAEGEAAVFGTEDAFADTGFVTDGVTDDDDGLAEEVGGEGVEGEVREGGEGFVFRRNDFDEGEVEFRDAADEFGGVGVLVFEGDFDGGVAGAGDDVVVGDDVAVRIDEEAGAEGADGDGDAAAEVHAAPEEALEEEVFRFENAAFDEGFRVDIDDGGAGLGDGLDDGLFPGRGMHLWGEEAGEENGQSGVA